jgi:hypothetical protein
VIDTELDKVLDRGKPIATALADAERLLARARVAEPAPEHRMRLPKPAPVARLGALRAAQPVPAAVRGVRRVPAAVLAVAGLPELGAHQRPEAMRFVGLENFAFALQDEWFWKSLKNTAWLALASGVPQHLVAIPLAVFIHIRFVRLRNAPSVRTSCPTSPPRWPSPSCSARCSAPTTASSTARWVPPVRRRAGGLAGRARDIKPAIAMSCSGATWASTWCCTWRRCRPSRKTCTRPPPWTAPRRLQQFFHITLPSLKPMIYFGVTLSVIGGLQLFEEPFILTGGAAAPTRRA